jgi:hypothetical protein
VGEANLRPIRLQVLHVDQVAGTPFTAEHVRDPKRVFAGTLVRSEMELGQLEVGDDLAHDDSPSARDRRGDVGPRREVRALGMDRRGPEAKDGCRGGKRDENGGGVTSHGGPPWFRP